MEESANSGRFYFLGIQNHCRQWQQPRKSKMLALWKKNHDKPRQHIKKQRYYFANRGPYSQSYSQSYGFSSSQVQMWELNHKEVWLPKNWHFWIMVLEKTLESPLDSKAIKPVNPKGNQPWKFTGRTAAEAPILWPPDVKGQLIREDPMLGKVECKRRRG